jgi:integrase
VSIYRRGKVYWFNFVFKGRKIQCSAKVSNAKLARDIERAYWNQLARGEVGLPDEGEKKTPPTIGELLDGLQKDFELRGLWNQRNQSNFRMARAAFSEKMKAETLTGQDVSTYIEKKLSKGRAPATVNRAMGLVAKAFKLGDVRGPKFRHLSEKGNERRGFFERAEFDAVYRHLPSEVADFSLFCFLSGWRKGEAASIEWSDVEGNLIRLRSQHSKNGESRSVVIAGELVALMERRREARLVGGTMLSRFVFHRAGAPIQEFRKSWASACKKAGVNRLFHDLRRSAVRNMIRSGVAQSIAMKISGHKTASMFRRYDISSEDDLRSAMQAVERYHEATQQKVVTMTATS